MAVGDCSVTERRRWRPPTFASKTLQKQRGRAHGAGCVRQWFRTAEPLGERRYENWNTHTHCHFVSWAYGVNTSGQPPGRVAQSVGHLTRKPGGPGFDTRSGNILSFLLPLFQEGQLSVTGESMCTKFWLTA